MKEFVRRSVTGVFIVVVVSIAIGLGPYSFFALCSFIGLSGLFEFYRLFGISASPVKVIPSFLLAVGILCSLLAYVNLNRSPALFLLNIPLITFILISSLFEKSRNPFYDIGIIFLGQIYIILPVSIFYCYSFIIDAVYNSGIVFGYFLFLWASDSGGYIFGNLFGKYPLARAISPNKTWEGSVGGAFLVSVLVYVNFSSFGGFSLFQWMVIGMMVVIFGMSGDLVKSVMKRSFDVKDFGNMLPGHGGILDRFDSLLGSAPMVYVYLYILYG